MSREENQQTTDDEVVDILEKVNSGFSYDLVRDFRIFYISIRMQ